MIDTIKYIKHDTEVTTSKSFFFQPWSTYVHPLTVKIIFIKFTRGLLINSADYCFFLKVEDGKPITMVKYKGHK